jgi:hypothetical protein
MATRRIVLFTANEDKRAEYARTLGRYAVKPEFRPAPQGDAAADAEARRLVAEGAHLVVREFANVYPPGSATPYVTHEHLAPASNLSVATAWSRDASGGIVSRTYVEDVPGFLDTESRRTSKGFGWDASFRSAATGRTYAEDAEIGLKTSARDLVFARIIADSLHFDRPVDLAFMPTGQERLVDFTRMPLDHLRDVPWFSTPAFLASPVARLLASAVEDGVFYRSARSRRERNYWLPGLNGGVPLVPKKDDVHELTFQFHDIMHAVMPDLLMAGGDDPAQRRVYILHRMVGEAISLVAADHAFVDTMARSGSAYDFARRRIHPLFSSLSADVHTDDGFRAIAHANMRFALLGDDGALRALGADEGALAAYRGKYERFFVEDYAWTDRNHAAMAGEGDLVAGWAHRLETPISRAGVHRLGDFAFAVAERIGCDLDDVASVPVEDLAEAVFAEAWDAFFSPALGHAPGLDSVDPDLARSNAFSRWLIGQSVLYARYAHVPAIARMGDLLSDRLSRRNAPFGAEEIERLRAFHDLAVDTLAKASAISPEEARVFREVVPVFDPNFAFYDAKADGPRETLAEAVARILPDGAPVHGPRP